MKTWKETIKLLRNGFVTPQELCEQCIARAKFVKDLNIFITETHDTAKQPVYESSERFKKGKPLGILDGIPVAIKDNFSTKNIRTTCASKMLANYHPPYHATVVQKMLRDGAILMGKTNMDEFAMGSGACDSYFGPVKNPWGYKFDNTGIDDGLSSGDDESDWYIAGGSSGGSAASVATGVSYVAIGSDTGGSVRIPASFCGVVGYKPSYGVLSRRGLVPLVNSLDVPSIFGRCVDDASMLFDIIAGRDYKDSTTIYDESMMTYDTFEDTRLLPDNIDISKYHVGIPKEYHSPGLSSEHLEAWKNVADLLSNAGAKVSQVSLPHTQYSIVCYTVICNSEVASNMARYDGIEYGYRAKTNESTDELYSKSRRDAFNDVVRGRILAGNYFLLKKNYDKYFVHAQRVRRLIYQDFKNVFNSGVDVLLTPMVLGDPPLYSDFSKKDNRTRSTEYDVFSQPSNLAGVPAISVPVSLSKKGLPIALQFIANNYQDRDVLTAAKWLEQQMNFRSLNLDPLITRANTERFRHYGVW